MKQLTQRLDKYAIGFSLLCVLHCLMMPILIALIPAVGAMFFSGEAFHRWLLLGVLLTSCSGLVLGCKKHKNWHVLGGGSVGVLVLAFAAFLGHDTVGEAGEKILTILGSALVIYSHYKNFNLCQSLKCNDK